ncbi:polysaccharide biosynthesis C-terminal domain-containing protein [Mycoplasmatota bacterium]|nr:polysaccharide biosynthesis C-terminal domain-containing protein [Mycoplasmatota bacterium]
MYFFAIIVLAISLTVISNLFLVYFVGEEFKQSVIYVGWIALGYAFNGMYLMVTNYIFYAKKTKYIGLLTGTAAIINIILNILLVPIYGPIGAAYATTIVYFIQFISVWILSSKVYSMPWNILRIIKKDNNM